MTKSIISQAFCKSMIATYLILVKNPQVAGFVGYIKEAHLVYTLSCDFE